MPRGAARSFFATVERIAKHFCNRHSSTKEMHLKSVGLFFCARLRVDAPDVWF